MIGQKSIRVHLGWYWNSTEYYFRTDVVAFYAFDDQYRLVDVWVHKYTDSL